MIIFGTRALTSTKGSGEFDCPSCAAHAHYERKQVRRFFTLYFIPLIPLDIVSTFIECRKCRRTYKEDVLQYKLPPSREAAQRVLIDKVVALLAISAAVHGPASEEKLSLVSEQISQLGLQSPDTASLRQIIAKAATDEQLAVLPQSAGSLPEPVKEQIFTAVHRILAADLRSDEASRRFLIRAAEGLGFSQAHIAGLLMKLEQPPVG